MESKKLVFYMSDGHEEFVGVVDWSQDTAQHIHDLMEHCRTFRTNLDVVEIVAFAHVDVYPESALTADAQDDLADSPDGFLILDNTKLTVQDTKKERVSSSMVKVGRSSFDYEAWIKHADIPVSGRADLNLRNTQIRSLFQGLM